MRESHELRANLTELRVTSGVLEAQVLLQNLGNQSEALLAAEFGYAKAPAKLIEFSFGDSARPGGDLSEPHVIRPGDSLVVTMREKLDPKMFATHLQPDDEKGTFFVFVRFFSSRSDVKGFDSVAHCGSIDVTSEAISRATWKRCNLELKGGGV